MNESQCVDWSPSPSWPKIRVHQTDGECWTTQWSENSNRLPPVLPTWHGPTTNQSEYCPPRPCVRTPGLLSYSYPWTLRQPGLIPSPEICGPRSRRYPKSGTLRFHFSNRSRTSEPLGDFPTLWPPLAGVDTRPCYRNRTEPVYLSSHSTLHVGCPTPQ